MQELSVAQAVKPVGKHTSTIVWRMWSAASAVADSTYLEFFTGSKLGWVEIARGSCSLTVLIDVLCLICHLFCTPPVICATSLRAFITARLASFSTLVSCGSCILQRGLPNRPDKQVAAPLCNCPQHRNQPLPTVLNPSNVAPSMERVVAQPSTSVMACTACATHSQMEGVESACWNGAVASSTARTNLFQAY